VTEKLQAQVEVRGATKAVLDLRELGVRASDLRSVGRKIQTVFRHGEEARFASRAGGRWPPLNDATKWKKSLQGQNPAVLRATDRLYRSLTSEGGGDVIYDVEGGELRMGTKVEYAHFLLGTENMPARPPIGLRVSDLRQISRIVADHIVGNSL
jgi:phage gpG-like protein